MKTRIVSLFLFVCFSFSIWGASLDNDLASTFLEALELMEVRHDGTLSSIVEETQKSWLRSQGKERWQLTDQIAEEKKRKILNIARKIGFVDERPAQKKDYRYAILLGASLESSQARFIFLRKLWEQGVRFKELVFLTGERPLDAQYEMARLPPYLEKEKPKTEKELLQTLFRRLPLPQELRTLPLCIVSVPMQPAPSGMRRPNTADTIIAWMNQSPSVDSCLFISEQPCILYQDAVVRFHMKEGFEIETVGPELTEKEGCCSALLDSMARFLFQELKIRSAVH
ncbi:MAG: hypothetical protein ACM3JI_04985 [Anaerolineae bacterium]